MSAMKTLIFVLFCGMFLFPVGCAPTIEVRLGTMARADIPPVEIHFVGCDDLDKKSAEAADISQYWSFIARKVPVGEDVAIVRLGGNAGSSAKVDERYWWLWKNNGAKYIVGISNWPVPRDALPERFADPRIIVIPMKDLEGKKATITVGDTLTALPVHIE